MAYGIRFTGIDKDGVTQLDIEPHWWTISELGDRVELKWVKSNETGSYTDQGADMSVDEARVLHLQFRQELAELIVYNEDCIKDEEESTDKHAAQRLAEYTKYVESLKANLNALDLAVGDNAPNFSHFHVCIFEWESGL